MKSKTAILVGAAIILGVGTTTVLVNRTVHAGPSYQGKSMSYWLGQLRGANLQASFQAHLALLEIGEPAVPYLVNEFKTTDSRPRRLYRKWYPKLPASIAKHLSPPVDIYRIRRNASGVF